jgi:hypothetical protein
VCCHPHDLILLVLRRVLTRFAGVMITFRVHKHTFVFKQNPSFRVNKFVLRSTSIKAAIRDRNTNPGCTLPSSNILGWPGVGIVIDSFSHKNGHPHDWMPLFLRRVFTRLADVMVLFRVQKYTIVFKQNAESLHSE